MTPNTIKNSPLTLSEFAIQTIPDLLPIITQLENSSKIISSKLRKAGLEGNLGLTGTRNVYGEEVQKLDDFANELIIDKLKKSGQVATVYSEELEEPVLIDSNNKYIFCMDPIDGSSNIDVNLNLGTIFSVYKNNGGKLQKGKNQIVAGYILYSNSASFVFTSGNGVNGFTLDTEVDSYFLTHPNIQIPTSSWNYSINEGIFEKFDDKIKNYLRNFKKDGKAKLRYAASMVGDVHRFLLTGGIFFYPADRDRPNGKLRLVYEVNPMSFIIEQAGGKAVSLDNKSPLDIEPKKHDQSVPIILGSSQNIEKYLQN